jgi:hypothetical protein
MKNKGMKSDAIKVVGINDFPAIIGARPYKNSQISKDM